VKFRDAPVWVKLRLHVHAEETTMLPGKNENWRKKRRKFKQELMGCEMNDGATPICPA